MDVREKLLHNEIQNLGQMVQIVSFELTLLSDFLKEKFGSSYGSFRRRYADQCSPPVAEHSSTFLKPSPLKKDGSVTARKSTTPLPKKRNVVDEDSEGEGSFSKKLKPNPVTEDADSNDSESAPNVDDDDDRNDDLGAMDNELFLTSSGDEDDDANAISINSVAYDQIPEGAELMDFTKKRSPDKLIGRARNNIWKHYIVAKLPNGKLHATCPRCKDAVSCKVERLTNHYRKCVQGKHTIKKQKTHKNYKDDDDDEGSKQKVAFYISAMKVNNKKEPASTVSTPDNSQSCERSFVKEEESQPSGSQSNVVATNVNSKMVHSGGLGQGRRPDPVWEFFTVSEHPGTQRKITKCKRCEVEVSGKVERLRRHFIICHELDKEGDVSNSNHDQSNNCGDHS